MVWFKVRGLVTLNGLHNNGYYFKILKIIFYQEENCSDEFIVESFSEDKLFLEYLSNENYLFLSFNHFQNWKKEKLKK